MNRLSGFLFLLMLSASLGTNAQFYSGSNQEFGKNRVQYRDFNWLYYPSDPFEVYFYQGGKDLAAYVVQAAHQELEPLEKRFDYSLDETIQVIVYNKQSEFRQSNIGLQDSDGYNIGGTARIVGSKLFLYYTGDHEELHRQIRSNLARVLFAQMMYGGDWKDVIKNSTMLALPEWFEEGLIRHASHPWDAPCENIVRSGLESGSFEHFNRLNSLEAPIAGHALWKYIADVYGENVIPNILYMARVSRNVENGFLFVLGLSLDELLSDFRTYYQSRFEQLDGGRLSPDDAPLVSVKPPKRNLGALPIRQKKKYTYGQFRISPDGAYAAFTTNERGQYKVWLVDLTSGKKKRLYKGDYKVARIIDNTYPVLAWHPTSQLVTWTMEKKGRAYLGSYRLDEKKITEKELFRIDKVIDLSYSENGRQMIFSGVAEGQTDLYLYQVIGNNQQRITNDLYDDLNPRFLPGSDRVIFASNRPDDTLRIDVPVAPVSNERDIFILNLKSRSLEQVTDSPLESEFMPSDYDGKNFTYLSRASGITNRYIAYLDSAISRIDTTIHYRYFTVSRPVSDFAMSPLDYHFDPGSGTYTMMHYRNGGYRFSTGSKANDQALDGLKAVEGLGQVAPPSPEGLEFPEPEREVDIRDYQFEGETRDYDYQKEKVELDLTAPPDTGTPDGEVAASPKQITVPKSRNYRLNFATDYVLSQIDNSFANQFYQRLSGPGNVNPGISGLMKLGISDLFEDRKIVGGVQLSGSLENNDYGISYHNLEGRLDKKLTFMRRGQRQVGSTSVNQLNTHLIEYELKWPINEFLSIRGTASYRNDRTVFLSTDFQNLGEPNQFLHALGGRGAVVFDNTLSKGLNLYDGVRAKVWTEYYTDPFDDSENTDTYVFGLDYRQYVPVFRDIIAAFRISGATSLGGRRVVHYLGGVDNWLFQRTDNSTEIATDENYYYQTLAAPMRGFFVNARNGNSFALVNAELRVPVFKTFMRKPIKSDFVEHFQVLAFSDVGSAWTGLHPYSEDNGFNTQEETTGPVTIEINSNREPIIWGYGLGLRSRVLGYFVRIDWAWGVDDGQILPRVLHFSLNLDF